MKFNFDEKLTIKIVAVIIVVLAVTNAILLSFVNGRVKTLCQAKEAMAESMSKISAVLDKSSAKVIPQSAFMDQDTLTVHTSTILKQINDAVNRVNTMTTSLKNIAEATHYASLNLSDTNDMNVIQSRLGGLTEHSKKLFELNEKLSGFVLKAATLTDQSVANQDELNKKLTASSESVYLPILESMGKNKKSIESLQQEVAAKANIIAELKKTIDGIGANKDDIKQQLQQKQEELVKLKSEYSNLEAQIKSAKNSLSVNQPPPVVTTVPVNKTSYPELYYKLRGEVVEYNSKWGFVIINFGSDSKLGISVEGKEKEVNVPAPLDKEVYIARDDKFVAKAKIISVYSKYSVANVVFPVAEEIKKGYNVFFDQPKSD